MNKMSYGHVCLGQRSSLSDENGMERLEKKVWVGNSHFLKNISLCCAESSLTQGLLSSCREQRSLCSCGAWVSHCSGFFCCRAWALGLMGFIRCGTWAQ